MVEETSISHSTVEKIVNHIRLEMTHNIPVTFEGPVEMDETYIGGQRKNKRLHIRRIKAKRGHGTDKLAIVGLFDRATGTAYIEVIEKLDVARIFAIIKERVREGGKIYTDGFKMYRGLPEHGYSHSYVDHDGGEYVRGDIHTNNIEGFWGILKRKLACIGGMRREKLYLFVGEILWRFNHRNISLQEQEELLLRLIQRYKI